LANASETFNTNSSGAPARNSVAKPGQPDQVKHHQDGVNVTQNRTASIGQPVPESQKRTERKRQAVQVSQDRTTRAGEAVQVEEWRNRHRENDSRT
jgi:hypothetical protein